MMKNRDSFKALATAVTVQAVKDHKTAKLRLMQNPESRAAQETLYETGSFFRSRWFTFLCEFNPDLGKIRDKEMEN